ncbi:MAG TPA: Hsp33 family molecular chaperone HslO [Burkholderiales bacterium]|nr:Hsp33 family molecular chaperone HslO [Burkholderiales bacterium]
MIKNFVQSFLFSKLPVRGAYVELTDVWQTISAQKDYPQGVKQVLGELLAANVLITSNLKFNGKIIVQIQDNPKLDIIVSECSNNLNVRATAKFSKNILNNEYKDIIATGNLVISIDSNSDGKIYQSVISLSSYSISELLDKYMLQSEQLRSVCVIAYTENKIVGFILQQLPEQIDLFTDELLKVFLLAQTLTHDELLTKDLTKILKNLFYEDDITVFNPREVEFSCTCSQNKVTDMLKGLGKKEAQSIIEEIGEVKVTCEFCNMNYTYNIQDIENIFNSQSIDVGVLSKEIH